MAMPRAPTMNIHKSPTMISKADPLKHVFQRTFDALPEGARGHVVGVVGEFFGTFAFIFSAFAAVEAASASTNKKTDDVSTKPAVVSPALLLYWALAQAFSLGVFAWVFFRVSGGLFNPVVCPQERCYVS